MPSQGISLASGHGVGLMVAMCLLALGLGGCGYSQGSLYREDVQTVAVPTFTTRDYVRGLEFRLSKAVINNLEAHSPYKVVSRERADTILEAEVLNTQIQNLSHDYTTNIPQEQLVVMTVNFRWKDLRTGRILVERKNFIQTASYYPTAGENVWTGDQQAVERLALGIVQELQADW